MWYQGDVNTTTCEELLIEQAMLVKALNPNTKVCATVVSWDLLSQHAGVCLPQHGAWPSVA